MPNTIDQTGAQIKTLSDIVSEILNGTGDYPGMYEIYGPDINVAPNTPDGQLVNIIAQAAEDILEFALSIYTSFDPDQAVGRVLDQRCAINGVYRQGATYTITPVSVTVDRAITLPGLDTSTPFTVADNAGNQFQLITSVALGGAGTTSLSFQAAQIGPVQTTIGTIGNIITATLGVTGVNNIAAASEIGQAQESDASLRLRRQNSVSLPSKGFLQGLLGALLDIEGVIQAIVIENNTNATVGGTPSHSIWVIVNADASLNAMIAKAIYVKRNAGCGMRGATTVNVPQIDGTTFPVQFDHATVVNPWISFGLAAVTGTVDDVFVRNQLLLLLSYQIGQTMDTTTIVAFVKQIAPNAVVTAEGVSLTDSAYGATLAAPAVNDLFVPITTQIKINGVVGP